jgi:hypothetical protein
MVTQADGRAERDAALLMYTGTGASGGNSGAREPSVWAPTKHTIRVSS